MRQAALSEAQYAEAEDVEAEDAAVSDIASIGEMNQMPEDNLATAYKKYICIQVAHFGAAAILMQYSTFQAPFITVKRLGGEISWSRMNQLLKDLAVDENTSGKI